MSVYAFIIERKLQVLAPLNNYVFPRLLKLAS